MLIPLSLARDRPLQQQLYDQLCGLIASRHLPSGSRLPSTRRLAEQFQVSRVTVLLAYERLIAEGYLETSPARGTFVARRSTAEAVLAPPQGLERRGRDGLAGNGPAGDARVGQPDPALFPVARWRTLVRGALDCLGDRASLDRRDQRLTLRRAIANWLLTSRGLSVDADQVVPVSSRRQALNLMAHITLRPGACAAIEDPCDGDTAAAIAAHATELVRVPVDSAGINPEGLPRTAALLHVTPEHQRPLGVSLTAERRRALLAWAVASGALVLEDDCDGELRYGDPHAGSLASMDRAGRVVFLGGFEVSLGPLSNLAFLVFPHPMLATAEAARQVLDDRQAYLEETALGDFLAGGGYALHLHRVRKIYAARRDALLAGLRQNFDEPPTIRGAQAGLHLAWLPPRSIGSPAYLAGQARLAGLEAAILPADMRGRLPGEHVVLLGFGIVPERQIEARVARFAELVKAAVPSRALSAD
jgi:GntR family transcriptional regulator/MocR family aminotransferase